MNRRQLVWFMALAMLTLLVVATAPAFPNQEDPVPPEVEAATTGTTTNETVETILQQQEQLLTGQGFTYDPSGRRDPFRNLFEDLGDRADGPRPRGIAGMVVAEVDLAGIVKDNRDGDMAFLVGSDNKGYFLRTGDAIYDGTIIAIDSRLGTVTFRQQVDDPRLIKPYRDVVKRLVPLEDEESVDE